MTTDARTFASPLHRQIAYWRIRQHLLRGVFSRYELAVAYGYSVRMINHIAKTATSPELHGLDEATALRASAAGVPVRAAAYLISSHATATVEEQAAHLDLPTRRVYRQRSALYRAGLLDHTQSYETRQRRRGNDGHLLSRVRDLTAQGWSQAAIATTLRQPLGRIERLVAGLGGAAAVRIDGLSLCEVSRLMGVPDEAVRQWIDAGWLVATRNPPPPRRAGRPPQSRRERGQWRVSRIALRTFVRCRDAWPSYGVATITDDELRDLARTSRATASGRWLSRKELAFACGVGESTIHQWISTYSWLADWPTTRYGKAVYHWQRDGVALVPPEHARRRSKPHQQGSVAPRTREQCDGTATTAQGRTEG